MKKAFFLLCALFLFVESNEAQPLALSIEQQARSKFQSLVYQHSEPLVREKLLGWLRTKEVIAVGSNRFPSMNVSEETIKGRKQVILWFSLNYLLQVPDVLSSPEDKLKVLELIIYHEAVHLDDHFSGRIKLIPLVGEITQESARTIWNAEHSAVYKQWALAKKWGKQYMMPVIYMATKSGETPRSLLEGFYQLQMKGVAVKETPELAKYFTRFYQEELAKLPKQ